MLSVNSIILLVIFALIGILCIAYMIESKKESSALKQEQTEWEEEQRSFAQGLPGAELYFYRQNAVIIDYSYKMIHIHSFQDPDSDVSVSFDKLIRVENNGANYTITILLNDFSHPSIDIKPVPGTGWENTQTAEQIVNAIESVINNQKGTTPDIGEKPAPSAAAQTNTSHYNPYITSYSVYHSENSTPKKAKKKGNNLVTLLVILAVCVAVFFATIGRGASEDIAESGPSSSAAHYTPSKFSSTESKADPIVYEAELTCGNYIAGIDFPAGTYDFLALSGNGNVMTNASGTGQVNTIMGVSGSLTGYDVTYQNVQLSEDVTLHIGGDLHLQIHSDAASGAPLLSRGQQFMDSFDLGAGDFVSGRDFKAGTYDIICTSGQGNISSGNVSGFYLNEVMGYDKPGYIGRADNIELPDGATLHISGITVTMSPSE